MEEDTKAKEASGYENVCDVHNITLVRNNSHAQKMRFMKDEHIFFMLDYFNFLKERVLDNEKYGYMALCGIDRDSSDAAVRKSMGIYATKEEGEGLFAVGKPEGKETSSRPFLGIVQIFMMNYQQEEKPVTLKSVRSCLNVYKEQINGIVQRVLGEDGRYQIFQTVTSEDFCVIIRSSTAQKIYDVVTGLMELKDRNGKRLLFTYTNVGIESVKLRGGDLEFLKLNPSVCPNNKDVGFAIRFRVEAKVIKQFEKWFRENSKETGLEVANGLFGRYDMVLRINIEDFVELYPFLCKNKAGYPIDDLGQMTFKSEMVAKIVKGMKDGIIRTVNTRILLNLYSVKKESAVDEIKPWFDGAIQNQIKHQREKISGLYERFKNKYEICFLLDKYRYNDLKKMLDRLMNLYENLAYEFDTHLNWFVCSQYLKDLFDNMYAFMEHVDAKDRRALSKFMNEFQMFINAFEAYIRILQGMNQHTMQAPQYDIVAPIDGQKFLIAFSEYINRIHQLYCTFDWGRSDEGRDIVCTERRKEARVLIYPEMTGKNVEMVPILENRGIRADTTEMPEISSILLCRIPMFEYFERVYDLIPLVFHEICHRMLILNRRERNDFFITRMLHKISEEICFKMQLESSRGNYGIQGDSLYDAFVESLDNVLIKEYKRQHPEWASFVSTYICISIEDFMRPYLSEDRERKYFRQGHMKWNDIMKGFDALINEIDYLEKGRQSLDRIQNAYHLRNKEPGWKAKMHREAEILYRDIFDVVSKDLSISDDVDDLKSKKYKELDPYFENICRQQKGRECGADKYTIKTSIEYLRRLHMLYGEILQYNIFNEREESREVLRNFANDLSQKVRGKFLEGDSYCVFGQNKMERVLFWEVLHPELAVEHYIKFFEKVSFSDICKCIDRNNILYRESCADIIMCKWLGLNSFGYLRLAITFWERMEGYYKEMTEGTLIKDRLITVLSVLLRSEDKDNYIENDGCCKLKVGNLEEQLRKYIKYEITFAEKKVIEAVKADRDIEHKEEAEGIVKKFFGVFGMHIEEAWKNVRQGKSIIWKGGIWDRICQKDTHLFNGEIDGNPHLKEHLQKEINLYQRIFWMLYAFGEILEERHMKIEKDVMDHMWRIYENMEIKEEKHHVVEDVVEFYNNPESEEKTNFRKMQDMLLFIQDYYYCNRFNKMWEERNENVAG